jgi:hypothetical protein
VAEPGLRSRLVPRGDPCSAKGLNFSLLDVDKSVGDPLQDGTVWSEEIRLPWHVGFQLVKETATVRVAGI